MKSIFFFMLPFLILTTTCQHSFSQSEEAKIEKDTVIDQPILAHESIDSLVEQLRKEENSQLLIGGPANIRANANGKRIDELPDLHPVALLKIEGKWAKIQYNQNQILMEEALHCFMNVASICSFNSNSFKREKGIPESHLQIPSQLELEEGFEETKAAMILEKKLSLFTTSKLKQTIKIIPRSSSIILNLFEVDFNTDSILIAVNDQKGWISLKTFKSLKLILKNPYMGCGAG